MNFLNRLRYGSVAQDQEEAATLEYRQARKKDYSDEKDDHDYGKSAMPEKYKLDLLEKGKGKYWMTKQYVKEKLNIGEDMFSSAEDELLYDYVHRARHTQKQMILLTNALVRYQKVVQALTSKETALGLMLAAYGQSATSAGMPGSDAVLSLGLEEGVQPCRDLMTKLGNAMQEDALLLSEVESPVVKLCRAVEAFREKSLQDCLASISSLNKVKLRYRGALLWMTDAANSLSDPDAKKELKNFRDAQYIVKQCKQEYEAASESVSQKTELLLASLNGLMSTHLPGYVSALTAQLKRSETTFKGVYNWSRENLHHQYRSAIEMQRDHAVLSAEAPLEEVFADFSKFGDLSAGATSGASPDFTTSDLIDVSLPKAAKESASGDEKGAAIHQSQVHDLDWLLADGDEADLEEILPMSQQNKERQQQEVAREERVAHGLESMLIDISSTSMLPRDASSSDHEGQSGKVQSEVAKREEGEGNVLKDDLSIINDMWAALGENPQKNYSEATPAVGSPAADDLSPISQQKQPPGIRGLFSRSAKNPTGDAHSTKFDGDGEEETTSTTNYAALLSRLEPGADERLLQGLLDRDPDCEDDEGLVFM